MIYEIKSDKLTARIDSLGAQLISLEKRGYEYMWQGSHWPKHAPVLFPICGRLKGGKYTLRGKEYAMTIHGFASDTEFSLISYEQDRLVLSIKESDATLASYPFRFTLTAEYSVEGDSFEAKYTVKNDDESVMPYMFGWHPAFALWGDEAISDFTLDFGNTTCLTHHLLTDVKFVSGAIEAYPVEGGKMPLCEEEIYSQDTLIFSDTEGVVSLTSKSGAHELTLTYSSTLPYLAIWKWPLAEARYICLEPWSGIPGDGVTDEDMDKKVTDKLAPGASSVYAYRVDCK